MKEGMKQLISLILILMMHISMLGQEEINGTLIRVEEGDKIGFINANGHEIMPVDFDAVGRFSEDILPVNKGAIRVDYMPNGGKWGFWTREGKELIPLKYEEAKIFREGLAPVKLNGKYGFINTKDEVEIEFMYEDAEPFQEELAAVKIEGKWGFIDKKGDFVIQPDFDKVQDFSNGFSVVFHLLREYEYEVDGITFTEEEGKFGLVDKTGELKLDTIYDHISKFFNGFAMIQLEGKEGFLDANGDISIPIQYDKVGRFSEGLAAVANYMMRDSHYNFGYEKEQIDSLGNEVKKLFENSSDDPSKVYYHPTYREFQKVKMQEPSEELIYGYVNEKGEVVIDFQFDEAEIFLNGFAKVRYGSSYPFCFATAGVIKGDENKNELPSNEEQTGIGANLIDMNGNLQLEKNVRILNRGYSGILISYNQHGAGAYNENFEKIIANQYLNLTYLGSGYFVGELMGANKKVLFGNEIELELDENYRNVRYAFGNRFLVDFVVERDGRRVKTQSGIINEKGEWILKPKYDSSRVIVGRK